MLSQPAARSSGQKESIQNFISCALSRAMRRYHLWACALRHAYEPHRCRAGWSIGPEHDYGVAYSRVFATVSAVSSVANHILMAMDTLNYQRPASWVSLAEFLKLSFVFCYAVKNLAVDSKN